MRHGALAIALVMTAAASAAAQGQTPSAIGRWMTEDGKGAVEIYRCDGDRLCGKVVWLKKPLDRDGRSLLDRHNPSPQLRSRPICGMVMMGGFTQTDRNAWDGGWAYDPESGKTYTAKMTLESPGVLELRGYVAIPLFGVTQTWTRAAGALDSCQATTSGRG